MSGFISYPYLIPQPVSAYSAEAQQFFDRVTDPGTTRKNLYATMIDAINAAGVWAKLDFLLVYAAADSATALTNLVQTSYGGTNSGANFTTDQSYDDLGGAAGGEVFTSFNPSTAGSPHFTQNSASMFAWNGNTGQTDRPIIRYRDSANEINGYIYPRFNDNTIYAALHGGTELSVASTDASGFWLITRTTSTLHTLYKNGTSIDSDGGSSTAVANDTISSPCATVVSGLVYCMGGGSGLNGTEVTALYNALHTYLQTVAGIA